MMLLVNNLLAGLLLLLAHGIVPVAAVATTDCPTSFSVDCISFSEDGGQCQSLHAVVRLRDNRGQPVLGATVRITPTPVFQAVKKRGKQPESYSSTTSDTVWRTYQAEVDAQCNADLAPYQGTTTEFCWQKAIVGGLYQITVVGIDWPACPNASWTRNVARDVATYTFTGQACT
jgi:hypothetical protein